jgi:hypothetical protein
MSGSSDQASSGHFRDDREGQNLTALAAICILCPFPSDQCSQLEIRRLSLAEAFPAMLSHAYCFSLRHQEPKRLMMRRYMDLTTRVPIFELRYKRDLERITEVADEIEATVNSVCPELSLVMDTA